MAATTSSDVSEGPVLSLVNKRLRALRKKFNRILQMEESISQGKAINKEQEEVLRSKSAVSALIEELEKLRQPLSSAVQEEVSLALQNNQISLSDQPLDENHLKAEEPESKKDVFSPTVVEDLLNLLYFGSLFDVKSQNDFTSTILTRSHERGCCLTYDYVTDDATDLLSEKDLDSISLLGGLLISRPADSSLSHKNALQRCIERAKLWLANADQPIEPNANVTYANLRERLNKIMSSEYFITSPEMKAVEVAAAAAGNYASFQVPVHGSVEPVSVADEVEDSVSQFEEKDGGTANFQGHENEDDDQSGSEQELQKDEAEAEHVAVVYPQQEHLQPLGDVELNQRDVEAMEQQYIPRRGYQNQRGGGRGGSGGRRGYSNGRGGGGRGGGGRAGGYQNGRSNQYYDQPGNYYPRNYYNNRGRGGRGGGHYNHGSGGQVAADAGVGGVQS